MHPSPRSPRSRRPAPLQVCQLEAREVPASISGRVFLDYDYSGTFNGPDAGIPGVTITLRATDPRMLPLTTTTDAEGNYTFSNLPTGMYSVTETQPALPAMMNGRAIVGTGGTQIVVDRSGPQLADDVAGPPPIGFGRGVVLGGDRVGYIFLFSESTEATGFNFTEIPRVSTGGFVFEDVNNNGARDPGEPGIAGVAVTLTPTSPLFPVITNPVHLTPYTQYGPVFPKTVITDDTGAYTFTDVIPGTYTITETQPGAYSDGREENGIPTATVGADRFTNIDLTTVATSGGFNFGETKAGTLSGVVFSDTDGDGTQAATGEPGIAGVKIVLSGRESTGRVSRRVTTTGADGSYAFKNLAAGTYTVREVQPAGYADGVDKAGSLNGTVRNDRITGIQFTAGATATGYTFADKAVADLALVQAPAAAVVSPNGTVTITYRVKNRGSAAADAASVRINYGGLTLVSASDTAAFNPATKTWTIGTLAPGASQTLRLTFRMPAAGGTFVPTARASTSSTQLSTRNDSSASSISTPALTRLWLLSRFGG